MTDSRGVAVLLIFSAISGGPAQGGFDERKTLVTSGELARVSSLVIVGRVVGYSEVRPPASDAGPKGTRRFEAEIVVDRVEAGSGIRPGERIAVGFWSDLDRQQIETMPVLGFGCSDLHVPPQPGDLARIYLNRKGGNAFVSDYPGGFFGLDSGPRRPYLGKSTPASRLRSAFRGPIALVIPGLVPILVLGAWVGRRRRPGAGTPALGFLPRLGHN